MKNQKCYDKDGNFLGWFSRSTAVVCAITRKNNKGEIEVVEAKRGKGCPDNVGMWNMVSGYVEFDECIRESASRETKEECGIIIPSNAWRLHSVNSNPKDDKRQNITFCMLCEYKPEYGTFFTEHSEPDEVDDVRWIKAKDVDKYEWAFGHEKLIKRIVWEKYLF